MRGRALAVTAAALGLAVLPAGAAAAHPLGSFTVNTADRLVVSAAGVSVLHVVDLAELPTVQLGQASADVDTDRDGALSADELTSYAGRECARVLPLLELVVDGRSVLLEPVSATGESRPGNAQLLTTRLECAYASDVRPRSEVDFTDAAAQERNGWREVTAASECGPLEGSDVPDESPSGLLAAYPEELLSSPSEVSSARFGVQQDATCTGGTTASGTDAEAVAPRGLDRLSRAFTDFVNPQELSGAFAVVAVLASVLFGALHALAPGHGKTVMAAYLVGQRGTRRQALQLGVFVTFSHTASVLALGAAILSATVVSPELVVPATEVLSGVLLAAVGVYLLLPALRRLRGARDAGADHDHDHPHADHGHGRGHPHSGHNHEHDEHEHEHEHIHGDHGHSHDDHGHPPAEHEHPHPHGDDPTPARDHHEPAPAAGGVALAEPRTDPLVHSHGGRQHSHAPLPEGRIGVRTLAAVGVAGGLVPSPSALLVLLGATALGRAWFGVLLVLAYGLGMAATLTAAGLLLLRARAELDRRGWTGGRAARWVRLVPVVTAAVVLVVGIVLVARGIGTGRPLL